VAEGLEKVQAGGLQPESALGPVLLAVRVHRDLSTLPVFVRPGTILPIEPLVQSTEEQPSGPLTLRVFPGPNCGGHLYQDDGTSFAYKRGEFLQMTFSCQTSENQTGITIHIGKHAGSYPAWWNEIAVQVNGLPVKPSSATVNGKPANFTYADTSATIVAKDSGDGIDIAVGSTAH
jgi:alpha-glucosidase